MAKVVQFDASETKAETHLTPELKRFIERVVAPILVRTYITKLLDEKQIAGNSALVASCQCMRCVPPAKAAR